MKKIAFICDIHLDEKNPKAYGVDPVKNWKLILDDIRKRNINEVVFGGDIGAPSAYHWFFSSLEPFKYQLIVGNHDTYDEVGKYYIKGVHRKELFFSKDEFGFKFIYLDSSSKKISKEQQEWLAEELNSNLGIVIFVHHPILGIDTPIDRKHPLQNREEILELLVRSNKEISIFCGHYHMNCQTIHGPIKQIITQSAVFQVKQEAMEIEIDTSSFGYRVISFQKDRIESQSISFST